MGSCTSSPSGRSRSHLPLTFEQHGHSHGPLKTIENQFVFRLSNVCLVPIRSKNVSIRFEIDASETIELKKSNMVCQQYEHPELPDDKQRFQVKWNQENTLQLVLTEQQLSERTLSVKIAYNSHPFVEVLRISLYLIVHGPYHHSIQIPFNNENFRILFDAKISHIIEANLCVKELKINTLDSVDTCSCHFTIKALHEEEVLAQSSPSYTFNTSKTVTNPTFDEDQELERKANRRKSSRIKLHHAASTEEGHTNNFGISWAKKGGSQIGDASMPSLTFDISSSEMTKYFIQLIVWSSNQKENTENYICEAKFPVWKMLGKQFAIEHLITKNNQVKPDLNVEKRKVSLADKLYKHTDPFGSCSVQICLITEKVIQQSKYCSRTEEGIVNMRPAALNKNIKSNSKTIHELWKYSDEIDNKLKKASEQNDFEKVESEILGILTKICNKLTNSMNEVLYADSDKNESLINNQNILIGMLQKMFPFIEHTQNPFVSQSCWSIIINILKRTQFNLQNLSLKGKFKTSQARKVLMKKREVAVKYQDNLYKLVYYALKGYGLYHNDNSKLSGFLAFAFFRIPLFREYFFEVINYEDKYDEMEKKLKVFQTQIEPKTSFGSYNFAEMKGNWKNNFYDQLKADERSNALNKELTSNFKSKRWFMEMSYRDEQMYDFISMLFECLSKDSAEHADKWKYIEGYSNIVSVIMTELKERDITKYSLGLIRSSIQLLENEHMISPMLPLVCDKINVYEFEKVGIALEIIDEYLQMATKKKTEKLPSTFNQNYFFKVVKTIIQGDHYSSMNRLLIILYNFFEYFGPEGKYQLSMFLMGQIFFKLYYHWSKQIRYTFYMFLLVKIKFIMHQRGSEIMNQYNKVMSVIKVVQKINFDKNKGLHGQKEKVLHKKLKARLNQKFKVGNSGRTTGSKSDYAIDSMLKLVEDEAFLLSQQPADKKNIPYVEVTPKKNKLFLDVSAPPPEFKHAKSTQFVGDEPKLHKSEAISQIEAATSLDMGKGPGEEMTARKKRRPSVFLQNLPNESKYKSKITNELHNLIELTDNEIRHIPLAKQQMQEVCQQIKEYVDTHNGELPKDKILAVQETNMKG